MSQSIPDNDAWRTNFEKRLSILWKSCVTLMDMNPIKLAVPALIGLLVAVSGAGWWLNELMSLSFRTEGTVFSQYAPKLPPVQHPLPNTVRHCDPKVQMRWLGCF